MAVTADEIARIAKQLSIDKFAGWDGITYEHLKNGCTALYQFLAVLFNHVISYTYIPQTLKRCNNSATNEKRKSKASRYSYRGITLMYVIDKLQEKVIAWRIDPWLEENCFPGLLQHCKNESNNVLL